MSKELKFNDSARKGIRKGVEQLSEAVKSWTKRKNCCY